MDAPDTGTSCFHPFLGYGCSSIFDSGEKVINKFPGNSATLHFAVCNIHASNHLLVHDKTIAVILLTSLTVENVRKLESLIIIAFCIETS